MYFTVLHNYSGIKDLLYCFDRDTKEKEIKNAAASN